MRKIKFRAWDTERKIFIPQGEIIFRDYGETQIEVYPNDQSYIGDSCHNGEPQRGRFVVSQFTGLKEHANDDVSLNQEIYEGDIIEFIDGSRAAVEWNDDICQWQFSDGTPINDGDRYATHKAIIGNIYENPELLQEVEKGMKENKSI